MLRDRGLGASLAANALVSTVMMTTLVVGPFHLARALGLASALIGLVMSVGPLVAAASGVPAGRLADRIGTRPATLVGLGAMAVGAALVAVLPATLGVPGYVAPIAILTAGYALFQTANNAAVMARVDAGDRGTVAGLLGLSRNLGLVSGASVMGAVFALASGAPDAATASAGGAAAGTRVTFAVAAGLVIGALALAARSRAGRAVGVAAVLLLRATPGQGQAPAAGDPYPAAAGRLGPPAGRGLFVSRWAEDWAGARAAGAAPPLKAMPLGGAASLTVGAEMRLAPRRVRQRAADGGRRLPADAAPRRPRRGRPPRPVAPRLRGGGDRTDRRSPSGRPPELPERRLGAAALRRRTRSRRRDASRRDGGAAGVRRRAQAAGERERRPQRPPHLERRAAVRARAPVPPRRVRPAGHAPGARRLRRGGGPGRAPPGRQRSLLVARGPVGANVYLDPFWIHSEHPAFRSGGRVGPDERDTFGARLWGRRGAVGFDWTLARQTGRSMQRDVGAWGLFAVQSLALSGQGWRPRLDLRADVASGGTRGAGQLAQFNPLYASSAYLGEGQFLGLANLLTVAPGLSVSPTLRTGLSLEYALARRLARRDAVRAGGMRAYEGTQGVPGRAIGSVLRVAGTRSVGEHVTLFFTHEHLVAGDVLDHAGLPSGSYGHVGATLRY
jgi:MFS family permease